MLDKPLMNIQLALRIALVALLLAMGWKYVYWDGPWRNLLWSEEIMSPVVAWFGWEWSTWVTDTRVERAIKGWTRLIGIWWLFSALLPIIRPLTWAKRRFYWVAVTISLLIHILLSWKSHFWQWAYLVEHSLFICTPLFFAYCYEHLQWPAKWPWLLRLAIAGTFIGHGMYALGYYPVPYHFTGMMMTGFGLTEEAALSWLQWIGIVDVLAVFLLFFPRLIVPYRIAIGYIVIWAFLTATARIWSNLPWYDIDELFTVWLPEFGQRMCHFLIPYVLWRYERRDQSTS